jgi:hypothetical protein
MVFDRLLVAWQREINLLSEARSGDGRSED